MTFLMDMTPAMLFLFPGFLVVVISCICWWWSSRLRKKCTDQTEGVVSEVEETVYRKKHSGKGHSYRAVFTYSVFYVEYIRRGHVKFHFPKFSVGQNVTVFYDPFKPQRYYVLEEGRGLQRFLFPIACGIIWMLMAGVLVFIA